MSPNVSGDGMYKLTGIIFVLLLLASPAWAQDLKVEKDDDPNPVRENGILTYTLTVTNLGSSTVMDPITITDKLPEDVRVIGVFTSDKGSCTVDGRNVTCVIDEDLDKDEETTVTITVQPTQDENLVNRATVVDTFAGDSNDETEITTEVTTASRDGGGRGGRAVRPPRIPPNAFRQYEATSDLNQAESDLQDAENELSVDEGEATLSEDSGNSDEGGAEASTPGAVASANGDEDTSGPVGPQGDVMNDIPQSGPLPNTGGISLLALAMPVLGVMLFGVALFARMRK